MNELQAQIVSAKNKLNLTEEQKRERKSAIQLTF